MKFGQYCSDLALNIFIFKKNMAECTSIHHILFCMDYLNRVKTRINEYANNNRSVNTIVDIKTYNISICFHSVIFMRIHISKNLCEWVCSKKNLLVSISSFIKLMFIMKHFFFPNSLWCELNQTWNLKYSSVSHKGRNEFMYDIPTLYGILTIVALNLL